MLSFNDLIKNKVAEPNYKVTTQPDHYEIDPIVNIYNNVWGCISDTHCAKQPDGTYIITGQLFRDKSKTECFVHSLSWGGYTFGRTIAQSKCLSCFAHEYRYNIKHDIINGDDVLVLFPYTKEQIEDITKYKEHAEVVANLGFKY